MREIILYSAVSLDQFIARRDGGIDWLFSDQDYGYFDFLEGIDVVLMGNKTYQQVLTFEENFPYAHLENYVFTRNNTLKEDDHVTFVSSEIDGLVQQLKSQNGKNIWLVGGGEINSLFLKNGWIDRLILSVHPIWLGDGLPLFPGYREQQNFHLAHSKTFESGLIQLELTLDKTK